MAKKKNNRKQQKEDEKDDVVETTNTTDEEKEEVKEKVDEIKEEINEEEVKVDDVVKEEEEVKDEKKEEEPITFTLNTKQEEKKEVEEEKKEEEKVEETVIDETKEEKKEEKSKDGWDDEWDMEEKKQVKPKTNKKVVEKKQTKEEEKKDDGWEDEWDTEEKVVKQVKQQQQQQSSPKQQPRSVSKPVPAPAPVQQSSGGWGGWFSSITTAVTSTINSIAQDDEEDPEPITSLPIKKEVVQKQPSPKQPKSNQDEDQENQVKGERVQDDKEKEEDHEHQDGDDDDEVEGLLNVVDKGIFKAADIVADSLFFAGSLLSSGFKSVQENANMENVKGLANMSLETTRKATNSELVGKGQRMASQMVDSSVERLESVGQRAYTMFSDAKKNFKESVNENSSIQQQISPSNSNNSDTGSNSSSPSNSNSNILPPQHQQQQQRNSSSSSTKNNNNNIIKIEDEPIVFKDNEFDASKCADHYNLHQHTQELERISVESTMKMHQFNRKTPKDIKLVVEQAFNDIKQQLDNESIDQIEKKKTYSNSSESFELEKQYNQYFDGLQEYLPTLANQSQPAALCRGLEKMIHFTSIGLELLSLIAVSSLDEKPSDDDTIDINDVNDVKKWVIIKSSNYSYLINKIISDIKSISSILIEIIKSKQNPQTRKYMNTITLETNNAIANINDSRPCFIGTCSIMYIHQVKSKPSFGIPPSPLK